MISKQSNGSKWLWSPNNISQSVIGMTMSEPINDDWSIIGTVEAGFDPISGELANSQRSQVMNNGKALVLQSANGDASRAGQWDNSQGFIRDVRTSAHEVESMPLSTQLLHTEIALECKYCSTAAT